MFRMLRLSVFPVLAAALLTPLCAQTHSQAHTFGIQSDHFVLDDKPFQVISGDMHYPRIPRARWQHDLKMAKAMGLNTITVYTFWNAHEPKPGHYDFSGNNDVAAFIRLAQKEGLYVILRPGPYVCAEWEFGGFPGWMARDLSFKLRTTDPKFMDPMRTWLKRLAQELGPLQAANGGPIIAVQIENEYGSYGSDREYMRQSKQALIDAGFGNSFLYSTDGGAQMKNDKLADTFSAVNFGPGSKPISDPTSEPRAEIAKSIAMQPGQPVMVGEFWDGWFDHWGSKWIRTDAKLQADEVEWMLKQGYGISVYMFVGGTSFGWMNGANSSGRGTPTYEPDVTSYDYDSVLQEDGQPSPKYFLFRDVIARVTGVQPPPVPTSEKPVAMPNFQLPLAASLWDSLPAPHKSEHPLNMEAMDQNYGYVLYRTTVQDAATGKLQIGSVHQYADVYVNGKFIGSMDRRLKQNSLDLGAVPAHARLDILVENTGRINFGPNINGEQIGLLGGIKLDGNELLNWENYSLPMDSFTHLKFTRKPCEGPCFYRGTTTVAAPASTYIDTRAWKKGMLWVNSTAVGRIWEIGPQGALYLPGSWLKKGVNTFTVFDMHGAPGRTLRGVPALITDLGANSKEMVPD